jgi:hypothetical protein
MMSLKRGGTEEGSSAGLSFVIAFNSFCSSPSKGRLFAHSSNKMIPKAHMSTFVVEAEAPPLTTSGARYALVVKVPKVSL